jgi:hypothetical protein
MISTPTLRRLAYLIFVLLTLSSDILPAEATEISVVNIQAASTADPGVSQFAQATPSATPTSQANSPDRVGNILLGAMITLGLLGAGLMALGSFLRRNPGRDDS